jgi:hypothetical protein
MTRTGGSEKGTIRFKEELAHPANAGLDLAVTWLEPLHVKYAAQGLSYADLYTLAGDPHWPIKYAIFTRLLPPSRRCGYRNSWGPHDKVESR